MKRNKNKKGGRLKAYTERQEKERYKKGQSGLSNSKVRVKRCVFSLDCKVSKISGC